MSTSTDEAYEQCPYDPNHLIRRSRMMYHVTKCKQTCNKKRSKNKNATSQVTEKKISLVEAENDEYVKNVCKAPLPNINLPRSEEDWDTEEVETSYDPCVQSQSKPVLRTLAVVTKSERKAFKREERLRFSALERENMDSKASTTGAASNKASGRKHQ